MREGTEGRVMVLFDTEEEYAQLMTDFLNRHRDLPWELHTYTNGEDLAREEEGGIDVLAVAETAYCPKVQELSPRCLVILSETGIRRWEGPVYVDKYQEAEEVLRCLLGIYMETGGARLPSRGKKHRTVFIGNYSPVRRCMQTSFALTMSQLLAREHPTLYLNFEHYAGISELLPNMQTLDLADLLYFLNAEKDRFRLRLQTMLLHRGGLDYVPPMRTGQNLLSVTGEEWMGLLQKLEDLGEYEYVILDLSESIQGLFDILRKCARIYTLTREDKIARSKLLQYEQVLGLYEYGDVLEKTRHLSLSHIRRLPRELEQLTKGDLADLVKGLLKELEEKEEWSTEN